MEIYQSGEYMPVNEKYEIARQGSTNFSGNWVLLGAVRFNNFGYQVEFIGQQRIHTIQDWQFKNGKQKWHIVDADHGTKRVWMNPTHRLIA